LPVPLVGVWWLVDTSQEVVITKAKAQATGFLL